MCPFVLVLIQQRVQSLLGTHPELGPRAASVQSTGGLLVRSGPTDRLFWVVWGQMLGTQSCREEGDGGGQLRSRRHGRCLAGAGPLSGPGGSSLLVLGALQVSTCVVAHSVAYLPVCLTDTDTLFYLLSCRKSHQGGRRAWDHQSCDVQDSGRGPRLPGLHRPFPLLCPPSAAPVLTASLGEGTGATAPHR